MISRLTGTIAHIDLKYIVLDVQGVGYKVFTTVDTASKISRAGQKIQEHSGMVSLWTYLAVREDALDLYGFTSPSELAFFELLITISGIGPKTALGILNIASIQAIDTAIRTGDTTHLVKVSGVSKKMAEKIVLELKDKMDSMPSGVARSPEEAQSMKNEMKKDADALEALKSLGYSPTEARDALKEIDLSIKDTGAKVKAALKILGNK
jgi:Holliday junction DNA helicase RuvA